MHSGEPGTPSQDKDSRTPGQSPADAAGKGSRTDATGVAAIPREVAERGKPADADPDDPASD